MIIGTAGHIDHGKTVLIKALTGVDTDRLKEEKKRGISIELGFASFELPSGRVAGVVDVPGHEHFIKNMLAGATGFDLVLLTVAADDGVMPQTREHLAIVDLLGVKRGVVVITKTDLADDEMIELVKEEVRDLLKDTALKDAPIVAVSAVAGRGLDELKQAIDQVAAEAEERERGGLFRLPIDRVFTLKGAGTVVTGTLWSGELRAGDAAVLLPSDLKTRVRSIEVHGRGVKSAFAGQRVAVNLPGVGTQDISRGDVLLSPDFLSPTDVFDARFSLLKDAPRPIKNWARVRVHHGTKESLARVVLLEADEIKPGKSAYVQFRAEGATVVARGDRFIVRAYSPMVTIGGGEILDSHPHKHARSDSSVLDHLRVLEERQPAAVVYDALVSGRRAWTARELARRAELAPAEATPALEALEKQGRAQQVGGGAESYFLSDLTYEAFRDAVQDFVSKYQEKHPLESGVSKELVRRSTMSWLPPKAAEALLKRFVSEGVIEVTKDLVSARMGQAALTTDKAALLEDLERRLLENRFSPPSINDLSVLMALSAREVQTLIAELKKQGTLVSVENVIFHRTAIEQAEEETRAFLKAKGKMTVSEFKDLLETTRKYAVPLIEYFDRKKITKREGDFRTLA